MERDDLSDKPFDLDWDLWCWDFGVGSGRPTGWSYYLHVRGEPQRWWHWDPARRVRAAELAAGGWGR